MPNALNRLLEERLREIDRTNLERGTELPQVQQSSEPRLLLQGRLQEIDAEADRASRRTTMGYARNIVRAPVEGAAGAAGGIIEGVGLDIERVRRELGFEPRAVDDVPTVGLGRSISEKGQSLADIDPDYRGTLAVDSAIGAGSLAAFAGLGLLGRGAGMGTALARGKALGKTGQMMFQMTPAVTAAQFAGVSEAYQNVTQFMGEFPELAAEYGLDDDAALNLATGMQPRIAGAVQVASVVSLLRPLTGTLGQQTIRRMIETGINEYVVENLGAAIQNNLRQSYDPDHPLWNEVPYRGETAGIGAAALALLMAPLNRRGARVRGTTQDPDMHPTEALVHALDDAGIDLSTLYEAEDEAGLDAAQANIFQQLTAQFGQPMGAESADVTQEQTGPAADAALRSGMDAQAQPFAPQQGLPTAETAQTVTSPVDEAAAEADPEPTPAQAEAGNYRKGHVNILGLDISIETPAGAIRRGEDADGRPWEVELPRHYGYIRRTEGNDGDHVDVILGDHADQMQEDGWVFVVDQFDPDTGKFDEHKVVLGALHMDEAKQTYLDNYEPGWQGFGGITAMPVPAFREWLKSGKAKHALTEKPAETGWQQENLRTLTAQTPTQTPEAPAQGAIAPTGSAIAPTEQGQATDSEIVTSPATRPRQQQDDLAARLQNRDRSRAAYQVQMSQIAANPDYNRVSVSRDANTGAPMVFSADATTVPETALGRTDTVTMSDGQGGTRNIPVRYAVVNADAVAASHNAQGTRNPVYGTQGLTALNNGRTAGLQEAWRRGTTNAYVEAMLADAESHGVSPDAIRSMRQPMLVRVFDRRALEGIPDPGAASNVSMSAELAGSEQAVTDSRRLNPATISAYQPLPVDAAGNRDFVRLAAQDLGGSDQVGLFQADGTLSAAGRRRIEAALLARAFPDASIISDLTEATDSDLKSLGGVLLDIAGEWSQLVEAAQSGQIDAGYDITEHVIEAVHLVRKSRQTGTPIAELLGQGDMLSGNVHPMTEGVVRLFYRGPNLARIRARDKIAADLLEYARTAMTNVAGMGDMFGDRPSPTQILENLRERSERSEAQPAQDGLFGPSGRPAGQDSGEVRSQGTRQEQDGGGAQAATDEREQGRRRRQVAPPKEAAPETPAPAGVSASGAEQTQAPTAPEPSRPAQGQRSEPAQADKPKTPEERALAWVRKRAKPAAVPEDTLDVSPEMAAEDGIEPGRYAVKRWVFRGEVPRHMRAVLSKAQRLQSPLEFEALRFGNTQSTWNFLEYSLTQYERIPDEQGTDPARAESPDAGMPTTEEGFAQAIAQIEQSQDQSHEYFERYTELLKAQREFRKRRLLESNNGDSIGVVAKAESADRWAALFPEMGPESQEGYAARLQFFDADGFSGHMVYRTPDEALSEMVGQGYRIPDKGAMSRLQGTDRWARGMDAAEQVRADNARRLSASKEAPAQELHRLRMEDRNDRTSLRQRYDLEAEVDRVLSEDPENAERVERIRELERELGIRTDHRKADGTPFKNEKAAKISKVYRDAVKARDDQGRQRYYADIVPDGDGFAVSLFDMEADRAASVGPDATTATPSTDVSAMSTDGLQTKIRSLARRGKLEGHPDAETMLAELERRLGESGMDAFNAELDAIERGPVANLNERFRNQELSITEYLERRKVDPDNYSRADDIRQRAAAQTEYGRLIEEIRQALHGYKDSPSKRMQLDALSQIERNFEHPFRNDYATRLAPGLVQRFGRRANEIPLGDTAKREHRTAEWRIEAEDVIRFADQATTEAQQEAATESPLTPEAAGDLRSGAVVRNAQGDEFLALGARHDWLEVAPIVDGKPQVSAETTFKFHLNPETAGRYPERRNEPVYDAGRNVQEDAKPSAPIEDFGERIEGARKDYAATVRDSLDAAKALDIAAEPLSKTWPEPNYARLIEEGTDPRAGAFVRAARDEVPVKPKNAWKLRRWVAQVGMLRDFATQVLSGAVDIAQVEKEMGASLQSVRDRMDLYAEVGHDHSLKGVRISVGTYGVLNGEKFSEPKTIWTVEKKAKATGFSNWPQILAEGSTRAEAIASFKARMEAGGVEVNKPAAKEVRFDIYRYRGGDKAGKWFIGKKVGKEYVDLESFDDAKAAREYLNQNHDALVAKLEKIKEIPNHRKESNSPRVGADHRNGADVTPEQFQEQFGFFGVQFGNWVEGGRRQQDLNNAYDALMDLAGVLNLPPRALSLNGELGLAFGARGTGGVDAGAAHYEPGQIVINLTKNRGAGSLAHEWLHGLDNYFGRDRAKGRKPSERFSTVEGPHPSARLEMVAAFKGIMQAINSTALKERSVRLDRTRSKPYWSTGHEMAARAFESYIIEKLRDQGMANDYLANIVSQEYWDAATALGLQKDNTFPYPEAAEIPAIRAAFDAFFRAIEVAEPDAAGNVALREDVGLYSGYERAPGNVQDRKRGARLSPPNLDLFDDLQPPAAVPAQQQATDNFGILYKRVETEAFRVGVERVTNAEEAAHVMAPLRKRAEEFFYALVLDADGNILDLQMHSKGTRDGASVHPEVVVPAIVSVPGSAQVWFAHNHPSGRLEASRADMAITDKLTRTMDGSGVSVAGHVIFGEQGSVVELDRRGSTIQTHRIQPRLRKRTIPVTERRLQKNTLKDLATITDPASAKRVVESMESQNALVLLNNRHQVIGVMSMTPAEMSTLRTDGVRRVMTAIERTNAAAAIIKTTDQEAGRNLARFVAQSEPLRLLDMFYDRNQGIDGTAPDLVSSASRGIDFNDGRPFYSRSGDETDTALRHGRQAAEGSLSNQQIHEALRPVTEGLTVPVIVHATPEAASTATGIEVPADANGFYHEGQIHLIASAHATLAEAEGTLWHEIKHAGVAAIYGTDADGYNRAMAQIALRNRNISQAAAEWRRNFGADFRKTIADAGMGQDHIDRAIRSRSIEEALADLSKAHGRDLKLKGLRQWINQIVQWLRERGFQWLPDLMERLTDAEALGMIVAAREAVTVGEATVFRGDPTNPDIRYSRADPDSAVGRQERGLSSWVKNGQPIDRMFQFLFDVTGQVDSAGRWKAGVALDRGVKKALLEWKPKEGGALGWMNPALARARAGLIDRFGLAPEFVQREFEAQAEEATILGVAEGFLKKLKDANVGPSEAKVLQAILTGEDPGTAEMQKLAAPIREAIDELGMQMVELGLLPREDYHRHLGKYLHRSYRKYESRDEGLPQWARKVMNRRRRAIYGDELKARGLKEDVTAERLLRDMPPDWWGRKLSPKEADKQLVNTDWRILDLVQIPGEGSDALQGIDPGSPKKRTVRRVFWPADMPVPDRMADYTDRGTWKITGTHGAKLRMRRDFTKEEREAMGEILDARYNIIKTFHLLSHDIANGRFFADIAKNSEWAVKEIEQGQTYADPLQASRLRTFAEVDWVRVPDVKIHGTGAPKWGALAGMYVRPEIWRDIAELDRMQSAGTWRTILNQWKINKALALDTPLPTPTGWTTMGAIQEGDELFDEKGQVCKVLEVKEIQHGRPCYRVEFSDGTSIVADDEHWWFTIAQGKGDVRTTAEIRKTLKEPTRGDNRHSIPVADPIDLPEVDLPIPPYALGAWLGDGDAAGPRMSAGGGDVDEIVRLLTDSGVRCTPPNKDKRNNVYSFTMQRVPGECIRGHDDKYRNPRDCGKCDRELKAARNGGPPPSPIINPPLAERMTALGVRGDKHIPPSYLRASKGQRLALLQGIMDTDGCVTDRGACIVMTSIPRLRDGIMELLRSLGYKPTAGEFVPKGGKTAWRIHFHPYSDQPVFRLSRKAARLRHPPATRQRSRTRQIVAVVPVESVPVRCIAVSSESHLYLAGDGMVPTHNTARSPVVHANNVMSNLILMDLIDVRLQDLVRGIAEYRQKGEMWREARDHGAFGAGFVRKELQRNMVDPILDEIMKEARESRDTVEGRTRLLSKIGLAIARSVKKGDAAMVDFYQIEDEVFRMATFMRHRSMGASAVEAAAIARDQFLNYDIRAPWVNVARQTVLPFISYTYRAVPAIAQAIAHRPWKLAKYITIGYLANLLAFELEPGDEDEERRTMREPMQGMTWASIPFTDIGVHRMVRMPYRDAHDNPYYLDVFRWVPAGDVFDNNQGQFPLFPAWLQFGGPMQLAFEIVLNRSAFTGRDLVDWDTDTKGQATAKLGDYLWKAWMPSAAYIPGSWHFDKAWSAFRDERDMLGRPYSRTAAFASGVGIKVQPHDVELGYYFRGSEIQRKLGALRSELRQIGRDEARNIGTASSRARDEARTLEKIRKLEQEALRLQGH